MNTKMFIIIIIIRVIVNQLSTNRGIYYYDTIMFGIFLARTYQNISIENILRKHIFSNYDKVVIPATRGSFLKVNMRMMIKNAELVNITFIYSLRIKLIIFKLITVLCI